MFGSLHTYTKIIVKLHWWHLGEHLHNRVGSMNLQVGRDRQATRLPSIVMPHDPTANETTTDHCETKDNRSISKNLFKMIGSCIEIFFTQKMQFCVFYSHFDDQGVFHHHLEMSHHPTAN